MCLDVLVIDTEVTSNGRIRNSDRVRDKPSIEITLETSGTSGSIVVTVLA